jgi:Putative inner membrane exporter, YdcZ
MASVRRFARILFVGKVGAGAFAGLTITANILMSLVIDRYGLVRHGSSRPQCRPDRRRGSDGRRNRFDIEILNRSSERRPLTEHL